MYQQKICTPNAIRKKMATQQNKPKKIKQETPIKLTCIHIHLILRKMSNRSHTDNIDCTSTAFVFKLTSTSPKQQHKKNKTQFGIKTKANKTTMKTTPSTRNSRCIARCPTTSESFQNNDGIHFFSFQLFLFPLSNILFFLVIFFDIFFLPSFYFPSVIVLFHCYYTAQPFFGFTFIVIFSNFCILTAASAACRFSNIVLVF